MSNPILPSKQVEFNDTVLETKAWNSSRYDGRQLQGDEINKFTSGDSSYFNTPVLQNYSRNIYLGSKIVGMTSGSIDDGTLFNIDGFSYIVVNEFIRVNDDLSVTKFSLNENIPKKDFYRYFKEDFKVGTNLSIKTLDNVSFLNLENEYPIYENGGQLQKLLLVEAHPTPETASEYFAALRPAYQNQELHNSKNDLRFLFATSSTDTGHGLGAKYTVFNKTTIMDTFFTGSLFTFSETPWDEGSIPNSIFRD